MSKVEVAWKKVIKCTPLVDELFDEIESAIASGELKVLNNNGCLKILNSDVEKLREMTKTIGFLMNDLKWVGYKLNYNELEDK